MNIQNVIFLALIQGLTEFLPVSSSGHLVLAEHLLGLTEPGILLDVCLHIGTWMAVIFFFKKELFNMVVKSYTSIRLKKYLWPVKRFGIIFFGSLPVILAGLFFYDSISGFFDKPLILPFTFFLTAILLLSTNWKKNTDKNISDLTYVNAFKIGLFQAVALIPGVSRSGSTYAGGIWQGLKPANSFYLSFLYLLPAAFGAFLFELLKADITQLELVYLFAVLLSFLSGLIGLFLLKRVIKAKKIYIFAIYCLFMSLFSLIINLGI